MNTFGIHKAGTMKSGKFVTSNAAPVIALMIGAPLIAEVLPGATRLSALFVFPIEVCVWGIGALLIRHVVRKYNLGWQHMFVLALALSLAEELIIQQTSTAPLVVKIKGQTYARAFDVNYLYFLWAIVYETVFVVFVPVYLVEYIFPDKAAQTWFGKIGIILYLTFFLIGCYAAWFSWTQFARVHVFHAEPYTPPLPMLILSAVIIISLLSVVAIGPLRVKLIFTVKRVRIPRPVWLGVFGAIWAILLYSVLVLAFGIAPEFPVVLAVLWGLILGFTALFLVPRWATNPTWSAMHTYALIFGIMTGAMTISFVGFIVSTWWDLTFKVVINILAVVFMIRVRKIPGQQTQRPI